MKETTAGEILAYLRGLPAAGACEAAFQFLRETHRDAEGRFRIIDPATGASLKSFTANGNKYQVLSPEEGVGLRRFGPLRTAISRVGFEASLMDQFAQLKRVEAAFNKGSYMEAAAGIHDMMQAIGRAGHSFPEAFRAAALFVLREGEDVSKLPTEAETEAKIADWAEEGLHEHDFFFLCLSFAQAWNEGLAGFSLLLQGRV